MLEREESCTDFKTRSYLRVFLILSERLALNQKERFGFQTPQFRPRDRSSGMGEEAEALPGLSGVNLELHTGAPPSHALGPQDGSRRLPGAMGRGAAGPRARLRARLGGITEAQLERREPAGAG